MSAAPPGTPPPGAPLPAAPPPAPPPLPQRSGGGPAGLPPPACHVALPGWRFDSIPENMLQLLASSRLGPLAPGRHPADGCSPFAKSDTALTHPLLLLSALQNELRLELPGCWIRRESRQGIWSWWEGLGGGGSARRRQRAAFGSKVHAKPLSRLLLLLRIHRCVTVPLTPPAPVCARLRRASLSARAGHLLPVL